MILPKILIHNWEGARADFLGSVLLDRFNESRDGRVSMPMRTPIFVKMHDIQDINVPPKSQGRVLIRIDHNGDISNIMQIIHNQFRKNEPDPNNPPLTDFVDHFYIRVKEWLDAQNKKQIDRTQYDYWIDFSAVDNLAFIKDLYFSIRGKVIQHNQLIVIQANLDNQTKWQDNPELMKLSHLIAYELKFNLFDWHKKFTLDAFMAADNFTKYLTLQYYSRDEPY